MTTITITLTPEDGAVTTCSTTALSVLYDDVLAGILDAARGALIAAGYSPTHWDEFEWPRAARADAAP